MDTLNKETALAPGTVRAVGDHHENAAALDQDYWEELLTTTDAAGFCRLAPGTMANMRQSGIGPRFVQISARCIRYRRRDLKTWIENRLRKSTSDPGPDVKAA